jgi:hypothetical protein
MDMRMTLLDEELLAFARSNLTVRADENGEFYLLTVHCDVRGNVFGDIHTITGDVRGDVFGNVQGEVKGDVGHLVGYIISNSQEIK